MRQLTNCEYESYIRSQKIFGRDSILEISGGDRLAQETYMREHYISNIIITIRNPIIVIRYLM